MNENKKLLKVNCNWFSENTKGLTSQNGSWVGHLVQTPDGKLIGYAIDAGHNEPTHALAGILSSGEGITLTKIRIKDASFDPIYFDAFANEESAPNTYYGQFSAATLFQVIPMGLTSVEVSEQTKNEQKMQDIETKFEEYQSKINANSVFHGYILNETLHQDIDYAKKQITETKEAVFDDPLPDILKSQNQPS